MTAKHCDGTCHICGNYGKLSFEHVPPKSAFNERAILFAHMDKLIAMKDDFDKAKGRIHQKGAGAYTLCEACNSKTGHWYGSDFVEWAYQSMRILSLSRGEPSLYYQYHIFPLRVIKQIICMFFSAAGEKFRLVHPDLVPFVLNRDAKYIDPSIRIYAYYNFGNKSRQSGVSVLANIYGSNSHVFSEISYPPVGYIMSLKSEPPNKKMLDISFFARYSYNDWKHLSLRMPVLPVYTWIPADFRTREEVNKLIADNAAGEDSNSG
ncbi:MAG: hypothetical protein NT030_08125 [Candidatus Saganbacteria bacterium]|nr:hypothetical protein [Candidatus Saganbacteria bacterium]